MQDEWLLIMRKTFTLAITVTALLLSSRLALGQPDHPVQAGQPAKISVGPVHPPRNPATPDPKFHLRVTGTYDGASVKKISISQGSGPPRSYLSDRNGVMVLLKAKDGTILNRTNLPEPLEIRVRNIPRRPIVLSENSNSRNKEPVPIKAPPPAPPDSTIKVPQTYLEIFLPALEGATSVEFRAGNERGKLLGRGAIPR